MVIGLYGLPGSGKSFLLNELKHRLEHEHFAFYEGSEVIASLVPGGLQAFKSPDLQRKTHWREQAIKKIGEECADSGRIGIVTGHFMFWAENGIAGQPVHTESDWTTFTHILYLKVPAEAIAQRRRDDKVRDRGSASSAHLDKWQREEKSQMRQICWQNNFLFSDVSADINTLSTLIRNLQDRNENSNLSAVKRRLDDTLSTAGDQLETVLVIDGDKTLIAEDTGTIFWQIARRNDTAAFFESSLVDIFSSALGYSYAAFLQVSLLYEETFDDQEFQTISTRVASTVTIRPDFKTLLQLIREQEHVAVIVVTCGQHLIWEKILEKEDLSDNVKVIGGGRIADDFVITPAVKGALVAYLQSVYHLHVWAFGDSPLDLDMLKQANQAIVVVGHEYNRSKTMEAQLLEAIDGQGLRARQVVLPSTASPRLNTTKLPLVTLTDTEFIDSILCHRKRFSSLQVLDATNRGSAKLLMTPTRDANVAGPALREAHCRIGWYLAIEFLGNVIGLEEYAMPHVQGHQTHGYRLLYERQTAIVALMRGGEPMALGINDVFPLAMLVHAHGPNDVKLHHVQKQQTIVLVDSVVNSGKTVVEFVERIRVLDPTVRIVIVAGVVQAQSVESILKEAFKHHQGVTLVALRLSDNKFTGRRTTDTGNRLFNTTHLD